MTDVENKDNTGWKISMGGCGLTILVFVVVTICMFVAFPFLITMDGGSYAESQFFLNFVIPPICGVIAALIAGVVGFIFFFKRTGNK